MASNRSKSRKKPVGNSPATGDSIPKVSKTATTGATAIPKAPSRRAPWLSCGGFGVVLLACITWVMAHCYLVDAVTVSICEQADRNLPVEKRMPVFLNAIAQDGYTWNNYAEHLGENGEWRLRHTKFDNAPDGREVHWNSAFAWYLRGMGEVYRAINHDSLHNSIYRMSIWANPILLVLGMAFLGSLAAWRLGPLCGSVIVIGMVSVPTFYEGFLPAYPDHHGIIGFTILGLAFGLAWAGGGWVQSARGTGFAASHGIDQARHGMILSAVFGAAGLWISAVSLAAAIGTMGIAAVIAAFFFARPSRNATDEFHPELWRTWARWGFFTSLGFYVLEYFPMNMGFRMEVNHPFYALAFLGGGWGVATLGEWFATRETSKAPFPWRQLIWPAAVCSLVPLTVFIGGEHVYSLKDSFLWSLHKMIAEFQPLLVRMKTGQVNWQAAFGYFPLFVLTAAVLIGMPRIERGTKATLIILSFPILLITGLQFYQCRWGMLAGPVYIALAAVVVPQVWQLVPHRPVARSIAAAALLGLGYLFVQPSFRADFTEVWSQYRMGAQRSITGGQALALLHRQMARVILDSANGKPVVVLSSPNSSCLLSGFGGFRTVGTLYWENANGLKAASAGLNAQSDDEALAFMKKHGITHVSFMTWENFLEPYFNILHPVREPGVTFDQSFGKRALFDRTIPGWSRPLIFPPNDLTKALQQDVLLLQFVPDQSMVEANYHLARFVRLVQGDPNQAERMLTQILQESPTSSLVRVELADLYFEQKRFPEAVDQIVKSLPDSPPESQSALTGQITARLTAEKQWTLLASLLRAAVNQPKATATTLENAGWMLATLPDPAARDPKLALEAAARLEKLDPAPGIPLTIRAAALAAQGDFPSAIQTIDDCLKLAGADESLRGKATEMRASFVAGKVWTDGR